MKEEITSLLKNNTWILLNKPENKKVISNRWAYRVKYQENDTIDRQKARLVIKGYAQSGGVDYTETFSPVGRFKTIRVVLSVAALEQLYLRQFDIKVRFYMEIQKMKFVCNNQKVLKMARLVCVNC